MKALGASIAHELRTPLGIISSAAGDIKDYLPILFQGYELAKKEKLPVEPIDASRYQTLVSLCDDIESEAQAAFTVINMQLVNVGQVSSINTKDFKICSIKECIEEVLRRYPFDIGEKELIHYDHTQDFSFKGNALLMIHILFNLLKNAFYQIKAANKGKFFIWITSNLSYNELHIKDTANGIPAKILPHIFDRFLVKRIMVQVLVWLFVK